MKNAKVGGVGGGRCGNGLFVDVTAEMNYMMGIRIVLWES